MLCPLLSAAAEGLSACSGAAELACWPGALSLCARSSRSLAKVRMRRSSWLPRMEASWAGMGMALTLRVHSPLAVVASTT